MLMKKEYRKPEIRQVELRPEEAVLTACKTSGVCIINAKDSTCKTPAS